MLTILNENQLRQIFTCKRSPYFLFSVYVILPLSLLACLSYTYLSTSLLYFIYSSLSFFSFFIYPNFSFPLLLFVFSSWCFPLPSRKFLLKCSTGEEKKCIFLWAVDKFQLFSFFFFLLKNAPLILCTMFPVYFLLSSVLDTITKWKPLSVKTLKTSHFIFLYSLLVHQSIHFSNCYSTSLCLWGSFLFLCPHNSILQLLFCFSDHSI